MLGNSTVIGELKLVPGFTRSERGPEFLTDVDSERLTYEPEQRSPSSDLWIQNEVVRRRLCAYQRRGRD